MRYMNYILVILAVITCCNGINVNLQGTLSFGKEVIESLTHYIRRNNGPFRRSMQGINEEIHNDTKEWDYHINSKYLCRDIPFCEGMLEKFLIQYITTLAKAVKAVLETIDSQTKHETKDPELESQEYQEKLNKLVLEIKQVIVTINIIVTEKTEAHHWKDLIKRISTLFLEHISEYALNKYADLVYNQNVKKKIIHLLLIAIANKEVEFENRLCTEFAICAKLFECSKSLSTLLGGITNLNDEKVQLFMRLVSAAIMDSGFYSYLSEITANEFQVLLNDMAFADTIPTKDVLNNVKKVADERLAVEKGNLNSTKSADVALLNLILSDMDHIYAKDKTAPFHVFLKKFFDWSRGIAVPKNFVQDVITELKTKLLDEPQMQIKLLNEVRGFLEMTVDPQNEVVK